MEEGLVKIAESLEVIAKKLESIDEKLEKLEALESINDNINSIQASFSGEVTIKLNIDEYLDLLMNDNKVVKVWIEQKK